MKIDVRSILAGEVSSIPISYTLPQSELPEFDDVTYSGDVRVDGRLTDNAGYMCLKLACTLDYGTRCARCLEPVSCTLAVDFEKTVCREGELQDRTSDDYLELKDGMLDVDEALLEEVILNFPTRQLCREDCRGLCPKCGANLNFESCGCQKKEIDPRLAPLLKFFENDKNDG